MNSIINWFKRCFTPKCVFSEVLNDISKQMVESQQKLESIYNYISAQKVESQQEVVPNSASNKNERESIEFLVNLYTQISTRQKDLGVSKELANIQTIILHEMKRRNIEVHSSLSGTVFDPINMTLAPFPPMPTNNIVKENLVADSIVPLFTYKDKDRNNDTILHKEQVILYQYSDSYEGMVSHQNENLMVSNQFDSNNVVASPAVVGHLILLQYDEISDVYDIYDGRNIYGTSPENAEGKYCHPIAVTNEFLEPEHFEICDHKVRLLSGTWSIDYKGNKIPEIDISNGLKIIISEEISFVIIEK